jgi:hypothetical protein
MLPVAQKILKFFFKAQTGIKLDALVTTPFFTKF